VVSKVALVRNVTYGLISNEVVSFRDAFGGKPKRLRLDRKPFILERAKPSKDGDAKRWALTFWAGVFLPLAVGEFRRKGCHAAEGIDW
jgi:hypothetical protein